MSRIAAAPAPRSVPHRLPEFADLFVGRESELATLGSILAGRRARLVTLTGAPGIGKTRLAVAAAAEFIARTGRQASFVDLTPIREPELVISELVQILGLDSDGPGGSASAAADGRRLVLLDSCEHVLAAAPGIGRILAGAPGLQILATSRERLHLSAEQVFPVPALPLPGPGDLVDLSALTANPSLALLLDRARRGDPGFGLTAGNATGLVQACIRLEGMPLAIELAAARLELLTPAELAFRLGHRMDVLASRSQDVPSRHRTLRAAVAWSYELLSDREQALFRQLSVFVGGWRLADVEAVCEVPGADPAAGIESLLDKSLLRRAAGDGEIAEFSMLDSLQEYGAEQLSRHGEVGDTRTRHAANYAELAVQFEAALGLPAERQWWGRIALDQANLRVALEHSLATGREEDALALAAALGWYCYTRGHLGAGDRLVTDVLARVGDPDGSRAGAAARVAGGMLAWSRVEFDRAETLLHGGLAASQALGDVRRSSVASAFLGHCARACGRYDESARWHHLAESGFRELGNVQGVAWAHQDLGLLARDQGDLGAATNLLRTSLRDFRDLDYPWAAAWSAWGLGTTLCRRGRLDEAGRQLGEALRTFQDIEDLRGVAQCLEALAEVARERASYEAAARLLGAAGAQRERLAAPLSDAERDRVDAVERTLVRPLGAEPAERVRQSGRRMTSAQIGELAAAVAAGRVPPDPDREPPTVLTRREGQVAVLVASGRTNRQIGTALGVAEKTVEIHLQNAMAKLGARSRAEVAAWAVSHGGTD